MRCGIGAPGPASVRVWQIMSRCRGPRGGRPPPAAGGRSCRLCSRDLTEALDQQTATAEILRVISSSPTDVQPVFDAIVQSALRLLDGFGANVARLVGEDLHLAALTTTDEAGNSALTAIFPMPISGWNIAARAVRARAPVYLDDTETDAEYRSRGAGLARARGVRSIVAVPMMSQNNVVGTIAVSRREPGSFSDEEIALLQTFADQAVIADRERAPVQGTGGADGRADSVGREADGAGRGQPGGELDAGRRDGARHDRLPRQPAGRRRRLLDLRVRRRRRAVRAARDPPRRPGVRRGPSGDAPPEGRRAHGTRGRDARAHPDPRHHPARGLPEQRPGHPHPVRLPGAPRRAPAPRGPDHRQPVLDPEGARRVRPGGDRRPEDLRHPVGPGHPERPALPGDRGQEPPARGGQPAQVASSWPTCRTSCARRSTPSSASPRC